MSQPCTNEPSCSSYGGNYGIPIIVIFPFHLILSQWLNFLFVVFASSWYYTKKHALIHLVSYLPSCILSSIPRGQVVLKQISPMVWNAPPRQSLPVPIIFWADPSPPPPRFLSPYSLACYTLVVEGSSSERNIRTAPEAALKCLIWKSEFCFVCFSIQ